MPPLRSHHTTSDVRQFFKNSEYLDEGGAMGDVEDEVLSQPPDEEKPLRARIRFSPDVDRREAGLDTNAQLTTEKARLASVANPIDKVPIGTRLTMTSRTGYFQDRIISPSMVSFPVADGRMSQAT